MLICISFIALLEKVADQPNPSTGSRIQFITYLVYLILGLILGFLIRHIMGALNLSRKYREKKLGSDLDVLRKRIAELEEENRKLGKR